MEFVAAHFWHGLAAAQFLLLLLVMRWWKQTIDAWGRTVTAHGEALDEWGKWMRAFWKLEEAARPVVVAAAKADPRVAAAYAATLAHILDEL